MKRLLMLVAMVLCLGTEATAQPAPRPATDTTPITGQPRIINTASLSVNGKRIVLFGVDPMMKDQPCFVDNRGWDCGTAAQRILMNLIGREPVTCNPRLVELTGRIYAKCFVNNQDIGLALVEAGMALTVPEETNEYDVAQQEAMKKKAGIWRGKFLTPEEFRRALTPDERQPR